MNNRILLNYIKQTSKGKASKGTKLNIFMQETEPEEKDGIWLQSNKSFNKVISKENILIEPSYIVDYYINDKGGTAKTTLPSWIKENGYNYLFISNPWGSSNTLWGIFLSKGRITVNWNAAYAFVYGNDGNNLLYYAINGSYSDVSNYIRNLQESTMSKGNATLSPHYITDSSVIYSCSTDIYRTNGDLKFKAPELETFESNSIVIVQKDLSYKTIIIDTDIENGLTSNFSDVVFSDENSKVDTTIPTYYGNGTEWIKFKN